MVKIVDSANISDIGPREHLEDYSHVEAFTTQGQIPMMVALVCDGVGGVNRGERAAYIAANTILNRLKNSYDNNVINIIQQAVQDANTEVIRGANGGKCTVAMMLIVDDGSTYGRLFVANVGDSRVYLIRNDQLIQLTYDHNVGNDLVLQGVPPNEAFGRSNAHHLKRALGARQTVEVDFGLYHLGIDPNTAMREGANGLPLERGDTIFACSDGLTGQHPEDGQSYVEESKFLHHALDLDASNTARTLVSYALQRGTNDNTSIALVFVEGDRKDHRALGGGLGRRGIATIAAVFLLAVAIISFLVFTITQQSDDIDQAEREFNAALETYDAEVASYNATVTQNAINQTATQAAIPTNTPTFTPTDRPTLQAGQFGAFFRNEENAVQLGVIVENQEIIASDTSGVVVRLETEGSDGSLLGSNIYLHQNTRFQVDNADPDDEEYALLLNEGELILHTGDFQAGAQVLLDNTVVGLRVSGSCMSVRYDPLGESVSAACYDGRCQYQTGFGGTNSVPFSVGEELTLNLQVDSDSPGFASVKPIELLDVERQMALMDKTLQGRTDIDRCELKGYVPTATPTATNTPIPPPPPRPTARPRGPYSSLDDNLADASVEQASWVQGTAFPMVFIVLVVVLLSAVVIRLPKMRG